MIFYDNKYCNEAEHQKNITFTNLNQGKNNVIFLNKSHDKFRSKINDSSKDEHYILKDTKCNKYIFGNYIGNFVYEGKQYTIKSRFGDLLLKEMLKKVDSALFNHISIQDSVKSIDIIDEILYISFVRYLKLAMLGGFPSVYIRQHYRDYSVHGNLDVKNFIKKDLPFCGKISSRKSELVSDSVVARVLLKAYNIVITKNNKLKELDSRIAKFLQSHTDKAFGMNDIDRALHSRSLLNQMHKNYKKALELAKVIILKQSKYLSSQKHSRLNFGYLLYTPDLFEGYVERLLREALNENGLNFELKTQEWDDAKKGRADYLLTHNDIKIVIDAKYRNFCENKCNETDMKNLVQIGKYIARHDADIGILIYVKNSSSVTKISSDKKDDSENVYILDIFSHLKQNRNDEQAFLADVENFKKSLANIIKEKK